MMRGREFVPEFTSAVTNILNRDLVESKKYLTSVNELLKKIADNFKSTKCVIVWRRHGKEESSEENIIIKHRFLYWLINKMLWLKTKEYPEEFRNKIHSGCDKNFCLILEVLAQHDTKTFKEVIQHFLVFLQDLASGAKDMYEKKEVKEFTAASFGEGSNENLPAGNAFSIAGAACVFPGPKKVIQLMSDLLNYLKKESGSLKILTFDYVQQGLWPLLAIILRIPNQTLYEATLALSSELLRQDCFAISPNEQNRVVTALFAKLSTSTSSSPVAAEMLTLLVEKCSSMPNLKKICILNSRQIWRSPNLDSISAQLIAPLNEMLCITAEEENVNVLPRLMKSQLSCFQMAFAHTVVKELQGSEAWAKQKEKKG